MKEYKVNFGYGCLLFEIVFINDKFNKKMRILYKNFWVLDDLDFLVILKIIFVFFLMFFFLLVVWLFYGFKGLLYKFLKNKFLLWVLLIFFLNLLNFWLLVFIWVFVDVNFFFIVCVFVLMLFIICKIRYYRSWDLYNNVWLIGKMIMSDMRRNM